MTEEWKQKVPEAKTMLANADRIWSMEKMQG